ncbi:energy transducer TonB [Polaribacter pectinis]|uniref:energy transducer TonB n=1 Tax=Polaribacter pectinis TaxID=2738844 RepID=UPI0020C77FB0|nr:energy transducer TonB [Polaribacter pectinis]
MILFCNSCDKFSFSKNKQIQSLDTIVDFSTVDTFPSFKVCDSIIIKERKANCFRNTIHKKIGEELQKHTFTIKDSIDEIVTVQLIINSKGEVILKGINSSAVIKEQLPELDSVLQACIIKIPKTYAAIKRGIPVTTKYELPIRIQLKE